MAAERAIMSDADTSEDEEFEKGTSSGLETAGEKKKPSSFTLRKNDSLAPVARPDWTQHKDGTQVLLTEFISGNFNVILVRF
jgi:hypothetical protein